MQSPKSKKRPWNRESNYVKVWPKKETVNKKFYNSPAWIACRKDYIRKLQQRVWDMKDIYLLSLDYVPCERCLNLYKVNAYDAVSKGIAVDHIYPLNPDNALECEGYGKPLDHDNLQLLCKRHHSRKSNRDKRILKLKK